MYKIGFDTEKYLQEQSKYILDRVQGFDKLYLEFGGKLIGDKHAARVLPGFDEDAKMKLLATIKDQVEIIICVYAADIENNKIRGDYGITYGLEVLRLIDEYHNYGIPVNSVLITRYRGERNAKIFMKNLENRGMRVHVHHEIEGYPTDLDAIFGEDGFEKNAYIPTTKPVVVVSAPGANSGKLTTCLNQLYHDYKQGHRAGYAKFETFPVWNLSLKHPVNTAYESATVDIKDVNMIDNYHLEAYGETAVSYNRDAQIFPVIRRIIENITGQPSFYKSPTDMGVNMIASAITDNDVVIEAANQEIIRRSFDIENAYKKGLLDDESLHRMHFIMEETGLTPEQRPSVLAARNYEKSLRERFDSEDVQAAIAIELSNGHTVTGRTGDVMDASAAAIVNALKYLAGIADSIDLISLNVLETIQGLKRDSLQIRTSTLSANEVLIALAISAVTNPMAKVAYDNLSRLNHGQAHSTVILSNESLQTLKRLGMNVTNDPVYESSHLFFQ